MKGRGRCASAPSTRGARERGHALLGDEPLQAVTVSGNAGRFGGRWNFGGIYGGSPLVQGPCLLDIMEICIILINCEISRPRSHAGHALENYLEQL